MADERDGERGERADEPLSMEEVARLDAMLDQLVGDRRPSSPARDLREAREHQLAAQLRLAREGVEAPRPEFLRALRQSVENGVAGRRRRPGVSRGGFLRTAAALAGGAGLGVAGVEGAAVVQDLGRPHSLVAAGNERWYRIAAEGEVPPGGSKSFSAGGVLGILLNTEGRLHAVSAICTHMGCRLKPDAGSGSQTELRCLCHGSRFNGRGEVVHGLAPSPLPPVEVRVDNGHVYALGTRETV
ncbi:MAG: Rieske (2Fe-2S) protein [Chloroflexota bacterium]